MINDIFQACVDILVWGADLLGMTYEEINVWVFCVIWPIITLALIIIVVLQHHHLERNRKYVLKGCARERALAHQQVLLNLVSERVGPQVFKDIETEIKGLI